MVHFLFLKSSPVASPTRSMYVSEGRVALDWSLLFTYWGGRQVPLASADIGISQGGRRVWQALLTEPPGRSAVTFSKGSRENTMEVIPSQQEASFPIDEEVTSDIVCGSKEDRRRKDRLGKKLPFRPVRKSPVMFS